MTNPSFVNRVETLPPIGASDHDIVYSEINLALPQNKQQAHKVWCSEASGLLGMTAGVFQSMWPRLKSPLTQMLEFGWLWGSITGYLKPADIHTNHKSRYRFRP
jgi:hypothetical protein